MSDSHIKSRKTYSCTHDQCIYTTKRSNDLKRHLSKHHGEGQSRGHESSPKRTTHIRTAKQSSITSVPECQRAALRKPRVTRRIVSSDIDSSESVVIIEPSDSRTPIDKPKNEKTRKGPTSSESAVAIDNSLNEEIPEGTVNVQPEAALDGEADGNKSKELRKKFPLELKERKDSNNQNVPPTVLCTVCGTIVNPLDRKTFFCHPVLSVVICKGCLDDYNKCFWKKGKDGMEEECRWCGQGGELSLCDFCCRKFCKKCIKLNFGENECKHIVSKKWKCYVCNPLPLKELVDRCRKMQDVVIAEEFLQYLVGNISNRALFMRSLVRLKKEIPDMQKLQINLSLKHIGEVKTVLGEFEACVKKHLHGNAHKSDTALDRTNQEDCDSPERKSKSQMEETGFMTEKKEEPAGEEEVMKEEESAMDTAEDDGLEDADISQKESSDDTKVNQPPKIGSEHKEKNVKISENSPIADVDMESNDVDVEANGDKATSEEFTQGKELKENEQIETCPEKESEPDSYSINHKKVTDDAIMNAQEDDGNDYSKDTDCPSSQHSARKMKSTPSSPRSRRESHGANLRGSQDNESQEDEEAKLVFTISDSDDDSCDESKGSEYNPNKSTRSLKKSPPNAKKELFNTFSKAVKKEPVSSADSDHDETTERREGPGEDSCNPEEESGFDGIPGESSTGASQGEGGEEGDKAEKRNFSAATVTGKSRHSSAASESESSQKISESKSEKSDEITKPRGRKLSSIKNKNEPGKMYSAPEVEMKLKRHRKRNRGADSDDASENDAQDKPEEGEEKSFVKKGEEKADVEKESELEENPSKKAKKVRKSPAKIDPKGGELLSFDSSLDGESNAENDGCSGLRLKSLDKKSKKGDSEEVAEKPLMDELDCHDEEDNDDDGGEDDEHEEVGGEGSKRSKKTSQKKAKQDEDWNNSERRQNETGGGGGSRDGWNGGVNKKKKTKRKNPTRDLYKKPKNNWTTRKRAKEDVEFNNSERRNGTGGGGGSRDGKNGGDDKKKKGKGQDESTKKSRFLLVISPFSEDEEDEETSK